MSQTLDEMLGAWKKAHDKQIYEGTPELPPRFYEQRKRRTPRRTVSKSALTPMGEAVLARDLGLDAKNADPLPVVDLPWAELNPAWVPDGEPGSYEGRREPQQPLGNDADLWD